MLLPFHRNKRAPIDITYLVQQVNHHTGGTDSFHQVMLSFQSYTINQITYTYEHQPRKLNACNTCYMLHVV